MGVSTRNKFLPGLFAAALFGLGGAAWAGGGKPGMPAPSMPGIAMPGKGDPNACCGMPKGHSVQVPGVSIAGPNITVTAPNVGVNGGTTIIGGQSFIDTRLAVSGDTTTFFSGSGGAIFGPSGVEPTSLRGLNVSGGEERSTQVVTERVPVTEEVCVEQVRETVALRPVQAVCLDDQGTPHPASQVTGDKQVSLGYSGEIYRCMAGTAMQVTLGRLDGQKADFSQAQTFACRKGEALVHSVGGQLHCKPQAPQRDCNERSLLRRHGPGVKLVQTRSQAHACVPQKRTVMKQVQRRVESVKPNTPSPIVFDGGVGQGVY